ncbi:hypothetical protein KsCSTR_27690 [Candidatus Kuenenia stuttgartiensis]|jgi:hypothetical protein|uniref:Uncharacterized protein n=1 Tax=Kuenenia stuttgartiensis TaxID=174633 RepID=A0A6G7GRD3_KUEST|nr:hypothetical protein KsCSTR_27690 [Candidatus Kuenenia stuttgartiensis]
MLCSSHSAFLPLNFTFYNHVSGAQFLAIALVLKLWHGNERFCFFKRLNYTVNEVLCMYVIGNKP